MKPLTYLEWIDSASADGWHPTEGYEPTVIYVRSVGWVQFEDETTVTIVAHLGAQDDARNPSNQACGWMTIPKVAITHRREIRLKRKVEAAAKVLEG